jgi:uncharacterized protein (DUF488 family)
MQEIHDKVFTIGHSNHEIKAFIALLRQHRVEAVADVRSAPYSRFNSQFNREPFAAVLKEVGILYVYLGRELGGRSDNLKCYDGEGRIVFDRVSATQTFKHGLARVVDGAAKHRIALMCAEKEPLECHRTLLVACELDNHGVDVEHIHADGSLESHDQAMSRLIELVLPSEGPLIRQTEPPRDLMIAEAVERQVRRIGFRDKNLAAASAESMR